MASKIDGEVTNFQRSFPQDPETFARRLAYVKTGQRPVGQLEKVQQHTVLNASPRGTCFRVIKQQLGFQKTHYHGLKKNASQVNLLVGLANLNLLRRQLMAA
jgi:hypothetical protein